MLDFIASAANHDSAPTMKNANRLFFVSCDLYYLASIFGLGNSDTLLDFVWACGAGGAGMSILHLPHLYWVLGRDLYHILKG